MRGVLGKVCLVSVFSGLFVAAVLGFAHLMDLRLPCGGGSGCDLVATHPSSRLFGVPIALFGVAVYAALLGLAARPAVSRRGSLLFLVLSGAGTLVSAGLLLYSRFGIQATCLWCVASGVAMAVAFATGLVLVRREGVLPGASPAFSWALGALTAIGLGVQSALLLGRAFQPPIPAETLRRWTVDDLARPPRTLGRRDAPLAIVEFGDFACPACRAVHADLVAFQRSNPSGVRLAFRHYPLHQIRGHEWSRLAAAISELAGEKGRFWEFVDAVYGAQGPLTREVLARASSAVGLEPIVVTSRLRNPEDPAWLRVQEDADLADRLGVRSTPTFVVFLRGHPPISASARSFGRLLNSRAVRQELARVRR
ncbi:MAG: vitamin K epoxide reductase family protein [Fimbriimonadaceae bacterium]